MTRSPLITLTEAELRLAAGGGLMSTIRALLYPSQSAGKVTMSDILITSYQSASSP